MQTDPSDWKQMLENMGETYLSMGDDPLRRSIFKTVVQQSAAQPEFGRLYHVNGKSASAADLACYLKTYQDQGLIRSGLDLKLTSFLFLCALWGYNISYKYIDGVEREFSEDEVIRHIMEIFFNGISV